MQSIDDVNLETYIEKLETDFLVEVEKIKAKRKYAVGQGSCNKEPLVMKMVLSRRDCNILELIKQDISPHYIPCIQNQFIL